MATDRQPAAPSPTAPREHDIPTRDGVVLKADVYLGRAGEPAPTVIHRTAYDRREGVCPGSVDPLALAAAGFNVVVQDVRGRFASGGQFTPYRNEAEDCGDTLTWLGGQPWAGDAVALIGRSYGGVCQWLAAVSPGGGGPRLAAIAPEAGGSDLYEGWTYRGGALQLEFCVHWLLDDLLPPGGDSAAFAAARAGYLTAPWRLLGEHEGAAPFLRQWLEHPSRDAYWAGIGARSRLAEVTAPALIVTGWRDPFASGALRDFAALRASPNRAVRDRSRLVVGPWGHVGDRATGPGRMGGSDALEDQPDLTALHLRWLRSELGGGPAQAERVRLHVGGAIDGWRAFDDWPPAGGTVASLFLSSGGDARTLHGDGVLVDEPPGRTGLDRYRYDPADPAPSTGDARYLADGEASAPLDQRLAEGRSDILCYSMQPLDRPLALVGEPRLVVYAAVDVPDTDLVAKIVDVRPDGVASWVCDGVLRARYRRSTSRPRLLTPGRIHRFELSLGGAAHVFAAGHRLRLEVSSSDFPRYDPNPNTGGPSLALAPQAVRVATVTVHHGPRQASRLELPVYPVDRLRG